jgi:hypothetical protein
LLCIAGDPLADAHADELPQTVWVKAFGALVKSKRLRRFWSANALFLLSPENRLRQVSVEVRERNPF